MTEIESMREEQAPEQVPAPKRAPRRRTVKKDQAVVDAAKDEASTIEGSTEPVVSEGVDQGEEKPTKRRSRSRKAIPENEEATNEAPASPEGEAAEPSGASEGGAEVPADKPKRRSRSKRAAKTEQPTVERSTDDAQEPSASLSEDASERKEEFLDRQSSADSETATQDAAREQTEAEGAVPSPEAAQSDGADSVESEEGRRPRRSVKAGRLNDRQGDDQRNDQKRQKGGKKDQRSEKHEKRNKRDRNNRNKEVVPSLSLEDLTELKVADLRAKAAELELDSSGLKKAELVQAVYEANLKAEGFIQVTGVLDIMPDGYGFLRTQGYLPSETDCYVGLPLIRRNGLRKGDLVEGQTRPTRENEKYAAIQKVISVNGKPVEELGHRVRFADLTPVYPDERLLMEHGKNTITARVIDLAAPIGKGQRGLIVSPPKAGKTTILKDIAAAISANNPEVHLMCLLVDERPEEVTDMQRSIKGEVISSTFDMPSENHIAVAELVIERAKRMVEDGRDVVILLDSLTRLARAYNLAQPASGRILSGGVDSTALYPPKRFLGAARNIEHGGSLTILASALIDTGSKMDEVIFEEFKGTGNMELKLDRYLADRRIFPAIDPVQSGTRKEDLLLNPQEAPLIWAVRRILANLNNTERAMDMLIKSLKQTDNNQEFLIRTAKKAQHNTKDEGITEF